MRRIDMLRAREILRLKHVAGLSLREIAKSCACGKTTVSEILERAGRAGLTWPVELSDKQLMSLLYPPLENNNSVSEPDIEYVFYEMKKKGVTLMLLWEEYKEAHPDGIMYTQFCERYRKFKKVNRLTMHIEHKAGEEVQVDWAGQTLKYTETITGEIKQAFIFVAVLPASAYPFVYAYSDKKLSSFIDAHIRAYEYFGGVPKITIPDNTKTAVTIPDFADPVLNKSYNEMAAHYRTTVIPARIRKPKDKAADENMVGNVSRRILAPIRNRQFFSIYDINGAIEIELEKFICRPFAKMEGNRLTSFERIDKPYLMPLPVARYEYSDWRQTRVAFNYHAEYDGFYYSVDHSYAGYPCSIRASSKTIEIFVSGQRVASHMRNYNKFSKYVTLPEHMPEQHKAVSGWSSDRFISWADKIGTSTGKFIREVLESRQYPVQAYRACMAILSLTKNYSPAVMESAASQALDRKTYSYKYFAIIFKHEASKTKINKEPDKIIIHDNIRGSSTYAGGGINA